MASRDINDDVDEEEAGPSRTADDKDRSSLHVQYGAPPPPGVPKKTFFTPLWERFKQQLNGVPQEEQVDVYSGANLTLQDIAKSPESEAEEEQWDFLETEEAERTIPKQVTGWIGQPDPNKYAPGTNVLTPAELEEEVAKGNIVFYDDLRGYIEQLSDMEKQLLIDALYGQVFKDKVYVRMEDGSKLSLWDLYHYVHHNPELKALAERQRAFQPVEGDVGETARPRAIWNAEDGAQPPDWAQHMQLGQVAEGKIWGRRPTRWLKGLDGLLDFTFSMYVHEDQAVQVMGPLYAGQPAYRVLADEQYEKDVLQAGPLMGMSFMLTAARDVPYEEARDAFAVELAERLSGANPSEESIHNLRELYHAFEPARLVAETRLLDSTGTKLRTGSSLLVCTRHDGLLFMQAISPGKTEQEQEFYRLPAVTDPQLCSAVVDLFIGDKPVDPEFKEEALENLVSTINGYKAGNPHDDPHQRTGLEPLDYSLDVIPAKPSVFKLPRVGSFQGGTLVTGIRDGVTLHQLYRSFNDIKQVYEQSMDKASSSSSSSSGGQQQASPQQREQAMKAIRAKLLDLGLLSVQGMTNEEVCRGGEMFENASILEIDDSWFGTPSSTGKKLARAKIAVI